ncbi:MAG: galactokinase [Clostridiales bacterium]|nr:galactokinase [Clostridiales bacterium]
MKPLEIIKEIENGRADEKLRAVYVFDEEIKKQRARYISLLCDFVSEFGADRDVIITSAPGRTEVCGNHTDHNNGKVLAASVNLDAVAVAAKNTDGIVRVKSKGHAMNVVMLTELEPDEGEYGHSTAMVRGTISRLKDLGYAAGGFDAVTVTDVIGGSGLSSSAAFEVLIGTTVSYLFNGGEIGAVDIAKAAQYSENVFFGKPCGMLDQTASSVGTFVTVDFKSPENPVIEKLDFDFQAASHALCIIDTKGNHSDLTDEYAAVRSEMESVAKALGKKVLREIDFADFEAAVPGLVGRVADRAILRAYHFYNENLRVERAVAALKCGDFGEFKRAVDESGKSSYMFNQNVYAASDPAEQKISLALCLSEQVLAGRGVCRVHGGGFAGTIQAFVPNDLLGEYKSRLESVFGPGSCYVLAIRPVGGTRVM